MIKTFCQYSYGGFKTFFIKGVNNEELNYQSEVTLENSHDFPNDAHVFFQFGGSKIVYRRLNNNFITLVVRDIPCNMTDGIGRPISCAIQFIGEQEDRATLDNLTLIISNDIAGFSKFFADLFYVRQGLRIEGNKLREFINKWNIPINYEGRTHHILQSIPQLKGNVFLFVPLSPNFGRDSYVTRTVCNELNLKYGELNNVVLPLSQLMELQNRLKIYTSKEVENYATNNQRVHNKDIYTSIKLRKYKRLFYISIVINFLLLLSLISIYIF